MSDEVEIVEEHGLLNTSPEKLDELEAAMLQLPQTACPVRHHFAPGVYVREAALAGGTYVIGHQNKKVTMNILLKGRMSVLVEGKLLTISAPYIFNSSAGVRKLAQVHEDSVWLNVIPTDETDVDKIEDDTVVKSEAFLRHEAQISTTTQPPEIL